MKALVAAFNQEKALVGAFSVITKLRMELFEALVASVQAAGSSEWWVQYIPPARPLELASYLPLASPPVRTTWPQTEQLHTE